eukprot:10695091-Ditylum_brightwellii.AAC.1
MSEELTGEWLYTNFAHRQSSLYQSLMDRRNMTNTLDIPEGYSKCTMVWLPEFIEYSLLIKCPKFQ